MILLWYNLLYRSVGTTLYTNFHEDPTRTIFCVPKEMMASMHTKPQNVESKSVLITAKLTKSLEGKTFTNLEGNVFSARKEPWLHHHQVHSIVDCRSGLFSANKRPNLPHHAHRASADSLFNPFFSRKANMNVKRFIANGVALFSFFFFMCVMNM